MGVRKASQLCSPDLLDPNVSNPIFACFLCWTKITFWPLLTLFWSNSKVTYVQAGVSFDQWNGAFCFHLGQSELRVLCHVFHLMLTTWSSTLKNSCKTKTTIDFLACYFDLWSNKMDFKRNRQYSDVWLWK